MNFKQQLLQKYNRTISKSKCHVLTNHISFNQEYCARQQ